jgi:hypothetical protein
MKLTFKDYAKEKGNRQAAIKLLGTFFRIKYNFPLEDLPDSVSMSNAIDELEEIIKNNLDNLEDDNIKNLIRIIVEDFCEESNIEKIILE